MESDEDVEARALRSLLDDYDVPEALECLSPLPGYSEALDDGATAAQHGGNLPLAIAMDFGRRADPATLLRAKRADSNRARNERRFEVIHLRRQVDELQKRLEESQHKEQSQWRPLCIPDTQFTDATPQLSVRISSSQPLQDGDRPWEETAEEQKAKRRRAETENTRLRLLVNDNLKKAAKLKRILMPKRQRYALAGLELGADTSSAADEGTGTAVEIAGQPESTVLVLAPTVFAATFGVGSELDNAQIFDMLTRSLDRARSNLDVVFVANGLAATEKTYRSAKVEQDEANGTVMELVSNKLLPYALEATQPVAWRHFRDLVSQMPDRAFFKYRDARKNMHTGGNDMLAESYSIELGNGFINAKFDEWRVIRQFEEHDRIIIIYCLLTEANEFASEPVSGIRILEETYIVLRRPSDNPHITLMQSCYRLQPIQYKSTPGLDQTVAALTDFLFGFTGGRISINYQMIERALRTSTRPTQP